jgi:hypothetical protein
VALTVISGDGSRHTFALQTPQHHTATVAPGHPVKLLLKGVPNGTYAVQVDGAPRGQLIVGVAPGP